MRFLCLVCSSLLLAACGSDHVTTQATSPQSDKPNWHIWALSVGSPSGAHTISLPSGKKIRILSISKLSFAKAPPALMFSYQTDLSTNNMPALQNEVDEIWRFWRPDVEHAGLTGAVVSANEKPAGRFVKQNRGYNFVFTKAEDGTWSQVKD